VALLARLISSNRARTFALRELTTRFYFLHPTQLRSGAGRGGFGCGLLLDRKPFLAGLSNAIYNTLAIAPRSRNSQPLEQFLLDLMSLGQRLNWATG